MPTVFLIETPRCLIESLFVLVSGRARAIQILGRSHTCAEKLFLSCELRFGKHERRFNLLARRLFRGLIQREKWLPCCHLLPALHGQCFQLPGKGRCDINKFAFDISLEPVVGWVAATGEQKQ